MMMMSHFHNPSLSPNQCGSLLVRTIEAPLPLVWSLVRRFDNPQAYKPFVRNCTVLVGDGRGVGTVREVEVVSGMPAAVSLERLDEVDEEMHVMRFSIIGGDHRLENYGSTTTMVEDEDGRTVVVESYTVDIPAGSTNDDTCSFANTIIGCNLKCLARIAEEMACHVKAQR